MLFGLAILVLILTLFVFSLPLLNVSILQITKSLVLSDLITVLSPHEAMKQWQAS